MNTARWWAIVLLSILVTPGALAQDQRQVDEGSVTLVSDPFGPWEGYVNGSSTMSMEHLRWWIEDGNAVLIHPPQHFSAVVPYVADRWDWVIDLTHLDVRSSTEPMHSTSGRIQPNQPFSIIPFASGRAPSDRSCWDRLSIDDRDER